ncbi:MAG: hypothetical protein AB7Q00_14760 [Phycisphaerales bacterium]
MTPDQVRHAVMRYYREIGRINGQRLEQCKHSYLAGIRIPRDMILAHLRWMCIVVNREHAHDNIEKAMRWLGFIQGALWALGIKTIEDLKEDNK